MFQVLFWLIVNNVTSPVWAKSNVSSPVWAIFCIVLLIFKSRWGIFVYFDDFKSRFGHFIQIVRFHFKVVKVSFELFLLSILFHFTKKSRLGSTNYLSILLRLFICPLHIYIVNTKSRLGKNC